MLVINKQNNPKIIEQKNIITLVCQNLCDQKLIAVEEFNSPTDIIIPKKKNRIKPACSYLLRQLNLID